MGEEGGAHWPVIVHTSLGNHDVTKLLQQNRHKIRVSESTLKDSLIFPMSGVAFLLVKLQDMYEEMNAKSSGIMHQRLEKMPQVHRSCYILCLSAMFGDLHLQTFSKLQERFSSNKVHLLPVHNFQECVRVMIQIAQANCQPENARIQTELHNTTQGMLGERTASRALLQLGITQHSTQVLQDGLGSVRNIVRASRTQLMDCSLDSYQVDKINNFFEKDSILI